MKVQGESPSAWMFVLEEIKCLLRVIQYSEHRRQTQEIKSLESSAKSFIAFAYSEATLEIFMRQVNGNDDSFCVQNLVRECLFLQYTP